MPPMQRMRGRHRGSDCILLTRPDTESRQLAQALRKLPVECIIFPTLEIRPAEPAAAQIAAIDSLDRFHLAIFVSANAVRHGLALVRSRRTWPVQVRVAAVGVATARALEEAGSTASCRRPTGTTAKRCWRIPRCAIRAPDAFSSCAG